MKKLLLILLAAVLAVSVTACDGEGIETESVDGLYHGSPPPYRLGLPQVGSWLNSGAEIRASVRLALSKFRGKPFSPKLLGT